MIFTAGEMRNPRKNLPTASRRFFIRLVVFYVRIHMMASQSVELRCRYLTPYRSSQNSLLNSRCSLIRSLFDLQVLGAFAIGVICQSNTKDLTSGAGNANASPWVIGIRNAHIHGLPAVINAGILTSGWSAGNSYLYMSSRALYSLAVSGNAPKIFKRCNRYGLPVYAVLASSCFAPLAYLNVGSQAGVVFNWFISLTNTAGFTSWIMCCFVYLRFRKACLYRGLYTDEQDLSYIRNDC